MSGAARAWAPRFFATAAAFRAWLARNHGTARERVVGFHRVATGKGGLTYPQALEEALCFGWIDGLRRGIDAGTYSVRFTPRRPGSLWSRVNLRHAARLEREGRMTPAGRAALAARDPARTPSDPGEARRRALAPELARRLRGDARASAHFAAMPPGYRRLVTDWIMSAKRTATRDRRFATLLDCSRRGRRVPPLDFPKKPATAAARRPASGRAATPARKA